MRKRGPAIYALTAPGAKLARVLAERLGGEVFLPRGLAEEFGSPAFESLLPFAAERFHKHLAHVFVSAAGIAVRAIAPVLKGKDVDPPVVVVDQRGRFAVSLVSGHLGGANDLAREVAQITAGQAVISTATDLEDVPAIDVIARERGLAVADTSAIKDVNIALMAGDPVQVFDPDNRLGIRGDERLERHYVFLPGLEAFSTGRPGVVVDHRSGPHPDGALVLHPPCLAVGIGCKRGAPAAEIVDAVLATLAGNELAAKSLLSLGSVTIKADEPGLLEAAGTLGAALFFFEPGELAEIDAPNPSEKVRETVGTSSVCEAAAMLLAEADALLVEKTTSGNVTTAVALVS